MTCNCLQGQSANRQGASHDVHQLLSPYNLACHMCTDHISSSHTGLIGCLTQHVKQLIDGFIIASIC